MRQLVFSLGLVALAGCTGSGVTATDAADLSQQPSDFAKAVPDLAAPVCGELGDAKNTQGCSVPAPGEGCWNDRRYWTCQYHTEYCGTTLGSCLPCVNQELKDDERGPGLCVERRFGVAKDMCCSPEQQCSYGPNTFDPRFCRPLQ